MPPPARPVDQTYNELEQEFDDFANHLVQVENLIPRMPGNGGSGANQPPLPLLYFCIPTNEKMLEHWDTVADRLYKIRHCLNIEGVARQLALFEPPINPAALVKAVAGGMDLSAALADLDAPLPLYRFAVLLQKANEVCNDVRSLGAALLVALEKKDAEALGLLRQTQEIRMQEAVKSLREQQIDEAKENLEGLKRSRAVVETRRDYYRDIARLNAQEQLHLDKMAEAHLEAEIAQGIKLGASIISYLPAIDLGASGFGGSPIAKFKIGGLELGQAASLASDVLGFLSQIASNDAAMASAKGGFDRRWDDWKLQESLAGKELDQFDTQIAAAEIRVTLAEKELENHLLQMENAKATDAFMRGKYTNQDLYQWQTGQISAVYLQSYKLAYDLAKRAERGYRFELGVADSSYISFGYWDSLKKGLLAGERLQYDLRRLETAYLEQNRREFELTKHVSLAMLDPLALVQLRETGRCFFSCRRRCSTSTIPDTTSGGSSRSACRFRRWWAPTLRCRAPSVCWAIAFASARPRATATPAMSTAKASPPTTTDSSRTTFPYAPWPRAAPRTTAASLSCPSATTATSPSRAPGRSASGRWSCSATRRPTIPIRPTPTSANRCGSSTTGRSPTPSCISGTPPGRTPASSRTRRSPISARRWRRTAQPRPCACSICARSSPPRGTASCTPRRWPPGTSSTWRCGRSSSPGGTPERP